MWVKLATQIIVLIPTVNGQNSCWHFISLWQRGHGSGREKCLSCGVPRCLFPGQARNVQSKGTEAVRESGEGKGAPGSGHTHFLWLLLQALSYCPIHGGRLIFQAQWSCHYLPHQTVPWRQLTSVVCMYVRFHTSSPLCSNHSSSTHTCGYR